VPRPALQGRLCRGPRWDGDRREDGRRRAEAELAKEGRPGPAPLLGDSVTCRSGSSSPGPAPARPAPPSSLPPAETKRRGRGADRRADDAPISRRTAARAQAAGQQVSTSTEELATRASVSPGDHGAPGFGAGRGVWEPGDSRAQGQLSSGFRSSGDGRRDAEGWGAVLLGFWPKNRPVEARPAPSSRAAAGVRGYF
jgi:hypothetical protein